MLYKMKGCRRANEQTMGLWGDKEGKDRERERAKKRGKNEGVSGRD